MLTIPETLQAQADAAVHKADGVLSPGRFAVSGMLAGAYIGIGVVLMVATAGPLLAAGDGLAKLVAGVVFGVALTLVVFAGADLLTSAMMILPQGALMGAVGWWRAIGTMAATFLANLVGALLFAALIVASGVLHANAPAGKMIADMLAAKAEEGPLQLFVRGILPTTPAADVDVAGLVDTAARMITANRDRPSRTFTGDTRPGRQNWVYRRERKPCRRCGAPIRRTELGATETSERIVFWCPVCQT